MLRLLSKEGKMYCTYYDSPVGRLLLTCTDQALTSLSMNRETEKRDDHPILQETGKWLDAYFRGENPVLEIPLQTEGTPFQQQVWKLLPEIPYGEVRTYGDLAKEMARIRGKEKMSSQAVGQAVGSNPIGILIPCHRVVGAKGKLTGYAWGLDKKKWLLSLEGRQIENNIVL